MKICIVKSKIESVQHWAIENFLTDEKYRLISRKDVNGLKKWLIVQSWVN